MKDIEEARANEDEAWAQAAEARRNGQKDADLVEAIRLVEAATSRRMRLEQELKDGRPE